MKISLKTEEIDKYWTDDYYFCEDKILASVSSYFGCSHELMFAGAFNFGYSGKGSKDFLIGRNLSAKYFSEREYLEKYHGIKCSIYDKSYGSDAFLSLIEKELLEKRPVCVCLYNENIWQAEKGEEWLKHLLFCVVSKDSSGNIELIDPHGMGRHLVISEEEFKKGFDFGVTFRKTEKESFCCFDIPEFIDRILDTYNDSVTAERGCVDNTVGYTCFCNGKYRLSERKSENAYEEMLKLAEDILSMDFKKETEGFEGVLWTPFYFGLLCLYRSRLVFTKALRELEKKLHVKTFESFIRKLIASSSKWNYLRMVFTNCFHNNCMTDSVKQNMSCVIKEIAELEKSILEEFREIRNYYLKKNELCCPINISRYFNTYIFDHPDWKSIGEDKTVYGRYFYDGESPLGKDFVFDGVKIHLENSSDRGDSLVCLGQKIESDDMSENPSKALILAGSVLYNEMVYDFINVVYTDGTDEKVCIGFDGWIENEFCIEDSGFVVWKGKVLKRMNGENTQDKRNASVYVKSFELKALKKIRKIILPNNPFINLMALSIVR